MNSQKTVIFLDYFENLERVVPLIREIYAKLDSQPVIVSLNFDIGVFNPYPDLRVMSFDELLSGSDYKFMDSYVFDSTPEWHLKLRPVEGITEYKGLKFGAIIEEKAQRFFSYAVKNLEIALKIADYFNPKRMILIGEKNIFFDLSVFINKELGISASFIEKEEKADFFRECVKSLRRHLAGVVSNLCDTLVRKTVIKNKRPNGILIDKRLYGELEGLKKDFFPYLYIIEKGLRVRLELIKNRKFFIPLSMGGLFGLPGILNPFYRYWESIKKDVAFKNEFKYKDFRIWGVVERYLKEFIVCDFPLVSERIKYLEKLYGALKPRMVILREAVRETEKTIALTAKQAGVPTFVIQHGMFFGDKVSAYSKIYSDRIALWGKAALDWYKEFKNNLSGCVITGKPSHDLLYSGSHNMKEEIKTSLIKAGIDPDKDIILCLMNMFRNLKHMLNVYFPNDSEFFALRTIENAAGCFPEKQFIIKLHPFDGINPGELASGPGVKRPPNIFFVKDINAASLIESSSLVIASLFSTASLDAVILKKPLITLNFYKTDDLAPFAQRGVALTIKRPEHLPGAIRQVLEDKKTIDWFDSNRDNFVQDYAYSIDGKATQRVMDSIKETCNEYFTDKSSV